MSAESVQDRLAPVLGRVDVVDVERLLWVVVALALVGDVVTTIVGLHLGLTESNPIARGAIDGWGFAGLLALKGGAVGVGLGCRRLLPCEYYAIVPAGLAVPWVVAVVVNVATISAVV